MDFNKPPINIPEQVQKELVDLGDEEVVNRILVSGTEAEQEQLRVFHNMTSEQLDVIRFYARQRDQMHQNMELELSRRLKKKTKATAEEMSMGAFIEDIEPHVRDAVLTLRSKGYPTNMSGYVAFEVQNVGIQSQDFSDYKPSEDLLIKLEPYDIFLNVEPSEILFHCRRQLSVDELKEVWDLIAADLPDRGVPVAPSELSAAECFRSKQEKK